MRLFRKLHKREIERATPEISKQFLEDTKARDEVVRQTVERNARRREANHLGALMERAYGGL